MTDYDGRRGWRRRPLALAIAGALALGAAVEDDPRALLREGRALLQQERLDEAASRFARLREVGASTDAVWVTAADLHLAVVSRERGSLEEAERALRPLAEATRDPPGPLELLRRDELAKILAATDRLDEARGELEEYRRVAAALGRTDDELRALVRLAGVLERTGDLEGASRLVGEAAARIEELSNPAYRAATSGQVGDFLVRRGRFRDAEPLLRAATASGEWRVHAAARGWLALVPHLDRIYFEMGRLCAGREGDPHRWINPEFHGWWVGREFAIAVDVATGNLHEYEEFVRCCFGYYHPYYNGSTPVIHPQPAGLAITDSSGAFVGWHAITILRVVIDLEDVMRVYFYNPNNDSGQHWGADVIVSTQGNGERHGEASLPFEELASRLYIFHYDSTVSSPRAEVPAKDVEAVMAMARRTWAASRVPAGETAAPPR